jgi:tyrosinase
MPNVTRRAFIAGAAAIPFSVWLEKYGWAQTTTRVRYDARSTQGKAMLQIYKQAVGKMKNKTIIPEGDPRSWTFQWYTHWVKGSTTKTAELNRIYPSPSPWRSLAQEMWETCQAHGPGEDENFFLPWHRMFVYYFESIVRQVSGNNTFTLPYWNYSTADTTIRGVLPPEFRDSASPLFEVKRNSGVNNGKPIQQGQPDDPLSLNSLRQCTYKPSGVNQGFNLNLDSTLHGNVHVLVGNSQNMGSVPWAAGDPIFWMHHCNIDRLWASWNAAGRKNPVNDPNWLGKTFIFANAAGQRVVAKVDNFKDIAALGYRYDRLEPVPPCPTTLTSPGITEAGSTKRASVKAPVTLGAAPIRATLETPAGVASTSLADRVKVLPANKRLYLVLKNLRAQAQPGILYHVYLELPAGTAGQQGEQYHVGAVNFFDAVGHGDHQGAPAAGAQGSAKFYSFDITDLAKSLQSKGKLSAKPVITIAPAGQPAAEAKPVVGDISVVEQ